MTSVDLPEPLGPTIARLPPGGDGQVEAVDGERLVGAVAETEAADVDARGRRRGRAGLAVVAVAASLDDRGLRVGQLEQPLGGRLVRVLQRERLGERRR